MNASYMFEGAIFVILIYFCYLTVFKLQLTHPIKTARKMQVAFCKVSKKIYSRLRG